MSRLWPDRVTVDLGPERVRVQVRRPWGATTSHEIQPGGDLSAVRADWRASWSAVQGLIAEAAPARGALVSVELSNWFVRYDVLPFSEALALEADWHDLAVHRFRQTHGVAQDWQLRVASADRGRARVVSGIEGALLETVQTSLGNDGLRLHAFRPAIVRVFDIARRGVLRDKANCWLVIHEPGLIILALIIDGEWRCLRTRRVGLSWLSDLPGVLDREAVLTDLLRVNDVSVFSPTCDQLPDRVEGYALAPLANDRKTSLAAVMSRVMARRS